MKTIDKKELITLFQNLDAKTINRLTKIIIPALVYLGDKIYSEMCDGTIEIHLIDGKLTVLRNDIRFEKQLKPLSVND